MKCIECHKRPATLQLTQIINGQKKEVHVCELCAQKKGYITNNEEGYSLHDLLIGLFGSPQMGLQQEHVMNQEEQLECNYCHMSFNDFRRIGKFGCAHCYEAFKPMLDPIFRRIHSGSLKHKGKIPKRQGGKLHVQKELEGYRTELNRLIEQEEFEQAAVIRDTIRQIEQMKEGDHS